MWVQVVGLVVQVVPAFIVSTWGRWSGSLGLYSLSWRVLSFCLLSRFVFGALYLNMPSFRVLRAFLAGFMGFVWVCVACVLCVACGAFVRVNS